jgi:hypothetical protein
MAEDTVLAEDSGPWATENWWAARRLRYNIGLIVAGLLAFACYAAVVDWCIRIDAPGEFEITIFTTVFQGVGYLFMIAVANVCYFLGPLSERIVRPRNIATHRKTAFRLGFCVSVLLPFMVPAFLAYSCRAHAGQEKRLILKDQRTLAPMGEVHCMPFDDERPPRLQPR